MHVYYSCQYFKVAMRIRSNMQRVPFVVSGLIHHLLNNPEYYNDDDCY